MRNEEFLKWSTRIAVIFTSTLLLMNCSSDDAGGYSTPPPPSGSASIRLVEVIPSQDRYSIQNFGTAAADISTYQLCTKFSYTPNLTSLNLISGSLNLGPGQTVTLAGFSIDDQSADLGLYIKTSSFGNANTMVDFVQWGSSGNGRESVAVQKGIWSAGDFLSGAGPFDYTGDGNQNGVQFWQ